VGALIFCGAGLLFWFFVIHDFRGLSSETGMEQAQIARELARGNGFSTKMIRPLSLWYFAVNERDFPVWPMWDVYQAPLQPFLWSLLFTTTRPPLVMAVNDTVFLADRFIAAFSAALFLASVALNYLIARKLFDRWIAVTGCALVLLGLRFWQFSVSGLPQMLMLLLFSGCVFTQLGALKAQRLRLRTTGWFFASGALFGLLALTHALTVWIFFGALIFNKFTFRPAWRSLLPMLAAFCAIYGPWLLRNYLVSNDLFGLGFYSIFDSMLGSLSSIMRSTSFDLHGFAPMAFRSKIQNELVRQFGEIYRLLGQNPVAPAFFVALLQVIEVPRTSVYRWCVLSMWSLGTLGMAVFGTDEKATLSANDLHVLFIPLMVFYGLGLMRELWVSLAVRSRLAPVLLVTLLFVLSAVPLAGTIADSGEKRFHWPPYVPPLIAAFNEWTTPEEIILADMPWAVAWYADRRSLWLPSKQRDFIAFNDYEKFGGNIVGLYLTPVTGDQPMLRGLMKGEYKDWAGFVKRQPVTHLFPLRKARILPIDNECVYYGDRLRGDKLLDAAISRIRIRD
jgi:hypothetical protein